VFRQGALEDSRCEFVKGLEPEQTYLVKLAPEGSVVHHATGQELMEMGFQVEIADLYEGKIFEISMD